MKSKSLKMRIEFLFEKYSLEKSKGIDAFISAVNSAYYKFAASLYEDHQDNLDPIYQSFFSQLEPGYALVDIGGGTGHTYRVVERLGYQYSHYYFIEPAREMSDRLGVQSERLTVINEFIEQCWQMLSKKTDVPRVFIVSACLHHIIYLDAFLTNLKAAMGPRDVFLIAHEPNSAYHRTLVALIRKIYLFSLKNAFLNAARALKYFLIRKPRQAPDLGQHLRSAREELVRNQIVSPEFSETMVYAVTDYQVELNWKDISVPSLYRKDGYLTIERVAEKFLSDPFFLKTYRHLTYLPKTKIDLIVDSLLRLLFPKGGYFFFSAFGTPRFRSKNGA
ncbi:MAG: methyltransferase domain-containing protein [Bdellovibrionales bacterium]|nr:methyltransferase domain-containing protein [Bdellovibrionales bacterium]